MANNRAKTIRSFFIFIFLVLDFGIMCENIRCGSASRVPSLHAEHGHVRLTFQQTLRVVPKIDPADPVLFDTLQIELSASPPSGVLYRTSIRSGAPLS
jgi:hypothetical protein